MSYVNQIINRFKTATLENSQIDDEQINGVSRHRAMKLGIFFRYKNQTIPLTEKEKDNLNQQFDCTLKELRKKLFDSL